MRFANLGADFKLAACLGALAAIALLGIAFVAIAQGSIDGELARTLDASRADALAVASLFDRLDDLARQRPRQAADAGAGADDRATLAVGLEVDGRGIMALFDAAVRSAPGLADRIEDARRSFTRSSRTEIAGANGPGDLDLQMLKLRDGIADAAHIRLMDANAKASGARASLVEALGVALAVALGLTFPALRLALNSPVQALASALRSPLGSLPGLDRGDEAGRIARSLLTARAAIAAEARAEAEQAAGIRASEADAYLAESREVADGHARLSTALGAAMRRLEAGDLTTRLGDSLAGGAQLAPPFDSALERLMKSVHAFASSADAIRSTAGEISTGSTNLTRRGEQQVDILANAGEAVAQIATRASEAGECLARTRGRAATLDEESAKAVAGMRQATEILGVFAAAAEQVGRIIALVDEVAFQTKLLALNASVEAARAGEVGRGISVVALELRALAQRSTVAAREFDTAFSASTAQMRKGASLLAETGAAIDRIRQRAAEIESSAAEFDAGGADQTKHLRLLRGALDRIGAAAQENVETAEGIGSRSRSVEGLMVKLSGLLRHFHVGQTTARPALGLQSKSS